MSSPSANAEMAETIDPPLLLEPAGESTSPVAQTRGDPASSQDAEDPFEFSLVDPNASSLNLDLGSPAAPAPPAITAGPPPPAASPTSTPGKPPYLFCPYARYIPRFDLDEIADGLYERDRTLSPPPNDDVGVVIADPEHSVKLVRAAITCKPERSSTHENHMCVMCTKRMMRVENRDIVVTQIAAEVVRSVIKLHELIALGESQAEGMVEDEDGDYVAGRVDVAEQPGVIGDHLRADTIEDIGPDLRDLTLTATARIDTICKMLMQTKALTLEIFSGEDAIAHLVAAPFKKQSQKYPAGELLRQP